MNIQKHTYPYNLKNDLDINDKKLKKILKEAKTIARNEDLERRKVLKKIIEICKL